MLMIKYRLVLENQSCLLKKLVQIEEQEYVS
jgi:hypothetical protein